MLAIPALFFVDWTVLKVPHGVSNIFYPSLTLLRCTHKSSRVAPQRLDPPIPP